jgi:hypothetical protein
MTEAEAALRKACLDYSVVQSTDNLLELRKAMAAVYDELAGAST